MGKKIKNVAAIIFGVGTIASIILGIIIIAGGIQFASFTYNEKIGTVFLFLGLVIGGIGSFGSWVTSLLLEGFGELIISTNNIEKKLTSNTPNETTDVIEPNETIVENTPIVTDDNSVNENDNLFITKKCPECSYPISVTQTVCTYCGKQINWEKVYDYQK